AVLLVRDAAAKQEYLETLSVHERLLKLTRHLSREIEVLELGSKIQKEVQDEMEKGQREFVLRQQLKAIQKELGADNDNDAAIQKLQEEIEKAGMPPQAREAADRELNRLRTMPPASAEYIVSRTYLDWLIALPWSKQSEDKIELPEARRILDEDHYDLQIVKDRILEFLAVRKLKAESRGPILCFVGPPGAGKTSLGKSIARAMGRAFYRLSLGGIRDEAEIRGHRRTYVGALPGQIVQGLRCCGSRNPVFMLDEVDKLGSDFRGDPASALLEVLDPEQNSTFVDHYLDVPFDLSRIMFITTANILDTIPAPLRDRMEVLELPGYIEEEKLQIARRYLIPRQCAENGLKPEDVSIEATRMPGGKRLILTGQLGDVMQESAQAALSYVRSRAEDLGIDKRFFDRSDIHLHVPAGAVPKDGPSAGVTMATAMASLLTGRLCRADTAMTGEITLRGKVLPVGGIKTKVLGARRAGIKTIILPAENEKDLFDIPKDVLKTLSFHFVQTVDEVFEAALQPAAKQARARNASRPARAETPPA